MHVFVYFARVNGCSFSFPLGVSVRLRHSLDFSINFLAQLYISILATCLNIFCSCNALKHTEGH